MGPQTSCNLSYSVHLLMVRMQNRTRITAIKECESFTVWFCFIYMHHPTMFRIDLDCLPMWFGEINMKMSFQGQPSRVVLEMKHYISLYWWWRISWGLTRVFCSIFSSECWEPLVKHNVLLGILRTSSLTIFTNVFMFVGLLVLWYRNVQRMLLVFMLFLLMYVHLIPFSTCPTFTIQGANSG